MISKGLMELIFSAFSIERWNDHPRTAHFTEMGKQAHKAMIAYFIARAEEDRGAVIHWDRLIEHGVFSFLHRVVVTDIKPPIFHRLMADREQHRRLNDWVCRQLKPLLSPVGAGLFDRCAAYLDSDALSPEDRIIEAAHYIATRWEFGFIYHWSKPLYGIEKTRCEIMNQIEKYRDLALVQDIFQEAPSQGFSDLISLVGQLRFQRRWAQIQRLPPTSVLGHLLMVALLSWLLSLEIGAGAKRRQNNFYAGLFHDLPEVMTRDIISPVKRSVAGLEELIKELERQAITDSLFPLVPHSWQDDLLYFVMDEFENRVRPGGKIRIVQGDLNEQEGRDEQDPVDGRLIEVCDKLSAYIEAKESIRMGIHPAALEEAALRLSDSFGHRTVAGYDAGQLFGCFI